MWSSMKGHSVWTTVTAATQHPLELLSSQRVCLPPSLLAVSLGRTLQTSRCGPRLPRRVPAWPQISLPCRRNNGPALRGRGESARRPAQRSSGKHLSPIAIIGGERGGDVRLPLSRVTAPLHFKPQRHPDCWRRH
ncbi:hypothetical protein AAFF_G00057320 [Aldrovandia affinis]|uniref:Uncharacterized protein n=1 Tax=Aldrovandia affinis TaxID=143900 RepID=A0AAD7S132_9TELE|nr:hypothetical protein AAFF_G00057320 [Aldrovandia affinis]